MSEPTVHSGLERDESASPPAGAGPRNPWAKRWLFWLALAAVAIGGGLALLEFRFRRPIGSGPAGPAVSREAFAQQWTARKVHLFGAGDSITDQLSVPSGD